MTSIGQSYDDKGFAYLPRLLGEELTRAVSRHIRERMLADVLDVQPEHWPEEILQRPTLDLFKDDDSAIRLFLWGLTPFMEQLAGCRLLPTYNYFRVYRQGDVCRIHSDRDACEHSMTLALVSSDDEPWAFEAGRPVGVHPRTVSDSFGAEPFESFPMTPGDAVIYRGIDVRHGRATRNANRWSAHMFLHWVERRGPHAHHGFDGEGAIAKPEFAIA